jgi:hypothetical protein
LIAHAVTMVSQETKLTCAEMPMAGKFRRAINLIREVKLVYAVRLKGWGRAEAAR